MVAAVAMFAAASCTQELENKVPEAVEETVVFTASVDGAETKAVLGVNGEGKKVSNWVSGDAITILNGTAGFDFTTEDEGLIAAFSYTGSDFEGDKFIAVYPAGTYTADVDAKTVNAYIPTYQGAKKDTYNEKAALAVAYTEDNTLTFNNAHALLKFTINGSNIKAVEFYGNNDEAITGNMLVSLNEDDSIKSVVGQDTVFEEGKENEWTSKGTWVKIYSEDEANDWVFEDGATYYAAIAPANFTQGFSVNFILDDDTKVEKVKTTANPKDLVAGTILNLGTFEYTAPEFEPKNWGIVGSMSGWGPDIASMTFADGWYVAEGLTIRDSDTFKLRVNGSWDEQLTYTTSPMETGVEYDAVDGDGQDNMKVAVSGIYSVYLSADETKIKVVKTADLPTESTPDQPSDWAVAGKFNGWTDLAMVTTSTPDLFVAKNVELSDYDEFKIKAKKVSEENDGWSTSYGVSNVNYINENVFFSVASGSNVNISNVSAGNYDIYFDLVGGKVYLMTADTDHTSATEQTTNGTAPVIVNAKTIYLNTGGSSLWNQSEAWFEAWIWGDGDQWVTFKETDEADIYSVEVPSGTTGLKILRRGPEHAAGSWDSKWNNTSDITLNGNNCITITGWGETNWTLSTK